MKTRIVVHIALNAKNERVGFLGLFGGRMVPFSNVNFDDLKSHNSNELSLINFGVASGISCWKSRMKRTRSAVRFQRATLIGESK